MNYLEKTLEYYSMWLDVVPSLFNGKKVVAIKSPNRDKNQKGYSGCFHLYCFLTDQTTIISYSHKLENKIKYIEKLFLEKSNINNIKDDLSKILGRSIGHANKFYFNKKPDNIKTSGAIQLTKDNYKEYLTFFKTLNPDTNVDWLYDYFISISRKGYSWGVYENNKLVSVTDAPGIPYMSDTIVEPGINTLEHYRKQGYAKIVIGALIKYLLKENKIPIWSCAYNNVGSAGLARSLGYKKLADLLTVNLGY